MSEQVWFYTIKGERQGPVAFEVLQTLVSKDRMVAEDLAWKEGMADWVPVTSLKGISAKPKKEVIANAPPATAPSSMSTISDASIYETPKTLSAVQGERRESYGGIGRLTYFLMPFVGLIFLVAGSFFLEKLNVYQEGNHDEGNGYSGLITVGVIGLLMVLFMFILPVLSRLKNLGMSRWNILWTFIPIMNIWISYRLSCCPEGYHDHKKLDLAGKIVATLFVLFMISQIAILVLVVTSDDFSEGFNKGFNEALNSNTK